METPKKGDDDDLVYTDTDRETNEEWSEGNDQREESKQIIYNMINQKLMKEIREKIKNYLKGRKPPQK